MLRRILMCTLAALLPLALTSCASGLADDGRINVVASTNVWGDIAAEIGGNRVNVHSLISQSNQDPHEFAASANDLALVSEAKLLIENGGGYDDFVTQLVDSANPKAQIIQVSALAPADTENEHYWFDLATAGAVANQIAADLAVIDPANAALFADNAKQFAAQIDELQSRVAAMAGSHPGRAAILTEPLPAYLLAAAGFDDRTPAGLANAVENGVEIPAVALRDTNTLLQSGSITLLATNEQTGGTQTDELVRTAQSAGVPVIAFSEILPKGSSYLDWMRANVETIEALS